MDLRTASSETSGNGGLTPVVTEILPTNASGSYMFSRPLLITHEILLILLMLVGTVGNVLIILAIARTKKLRIWSNVLLVNMAIADLGVCTMVIPTMLRRNLGKHRPADKIVWCHIAFYLNIIFCGVSLGTLYCISLNRYILIAKPKHVFMKYCGRTGIISALVWVWMSTVIITLLPLVGFGTIEYFEPLNACYVKQDDVLSWWYLTVVLLVGVLSCIIIVPTVYILIFVKIHSSRKRIQDTKEYSRQCSDGKTTTVRKKENYFSREEMAVTRMMVIACLLFAICWTPFTVNHLSNIGKTKGVVFTKVASLCAVAHSVCNPVIYAGMNPIFRESFRKVLSCS